jgi:vancomycin permeability regulator SanA
MMKVGMARFYPIGVLAVGAALTWLRVLGARADQLPERADLIVVLGCEAFAFGAGTELRARSGQAAALFHAGLASRVLASGGLSAGRYSEPEAIRSELVRRGVPPEAIELDPSGRSTRRTIATLRRLGVGSAIAVSSRYHLPRIAAEARRQGVPLATSAAPRVSSRARYLRQTAREIAALWWYAIRPPRARPPRPRPS